MFHLLNSYTDFQGHFEVQLFCDQQFIQHLPFQLYCELPDKVSENRQLNTNYS